MMYGRIPVPFTPGPSAGPGFPARTPRSHVMPAGALARPEARRKKAGCGVWSRVKAPAPNAPRTACEARHGPHALAA